MARRDKAILQIEKLFKQITSPAQMRFLGNETVKVIQDRTRNQYQGVPKQLGNRRKLKKVTLDYSKWRRKQKNRHPDSAKGRKCNLTFTGKMLDELKVIKATKTAVHIGWDDDENNAKAKGQAEQGRAFLNLGSTEVNELVETYETMIDGMIKKV